MTLPRTQAKFIYCKDKGNWPDLFDSDHLLQLPENEHVPLSLLLD